MCLMTAFVVWLLSPDSIINFTVVSSTSGSLARLEVVKYDTPVNYNDHNHSTYEIVSLTLITPKLITPPTPVRDTN